MSRAPFLRRPPRRDQRSCRLGVEPLEDRRMLNVAPVTVDDLYSTDSNAALTVDATQPGFSSRIYESTPQGSSGGGGSGIDAAQFLGSRFFVDTTLRTGRIGGGIAGNAAAGNGKLFAAVVALSGPDDFPDSADLSTPDVLGHALLTIDASDFKSHLIAAPLDISLTAGWYAVVYGSGKFGATGSGSAPDTGTGGHEQLRTTNGAAWTSQTDRTTHFFLDGQALFVGVLANDSDADGDAFTASLVDDVQNGSLQFDADGTFTYTPDLDFVGADTFTYQANDGTSDSNLATVTINVVGVNLPPEANDDTYSVDEDIVLDVDVAAGVLDNDVDVNGDVLFSELFSGPSDGTLQLNLDGSFSYTPNENFFGTDTFTYRVSDGATVSEVATVVITINSVDDPPVAVDDLFSTELNTTLVVSVLEPEFGARIYESTQQGASGGGGGSNIDAAQFLASRFFVDATIRTGRIGGEIGGNSAAGNGMLFAAIVALSGPDDLPDSVDLSTPDVVGHALLPLDTSDIFGDLIAAPLDIELARGWYAMVYGSGKFGATGSGYAPATGSGGHELLTMWQGRWISQTNHASHFFLDGEAIPAGVLANDSDAEGEPLTASLVDDVQNGTLQFNADGTFTYTPNQDFVGTDTFTYQANDGAVNSSLATVTLNVVDVNLPPTASDNAYRVDEDNLLEVDAAAGVLDNDVDANGDVLTATLVSGPDQGTLQLNPDGSFSYTPESDFFGEDSFTYVANDGELDSEPATVTITVDPVQDAPVAIDDAYEVNEDTTTNLLAPSDGLVHHWTFDETSGDVLSDSAGELNGSLVNWGASEETWVEGVVGGALDMGDADNHVLLDGSIGSGDTYTISVWSRLDQTGALNPRILGWLLQNTEIAGGVGIYFKYQSGQAYSPSDPVVGQWEHYALTTDRISGAATIYRDGVAVGTGTFRPDRPDGRPWLIGHHINPGYHGASWQGALDDLRVYDRVLSAQEVQNLYLAVTTGSALGVLLNDSDADGDALTAAVVDEPEHGDLAFNLDGTFTYTPDAEFSGTDSFTYRANDGTEDSNLAVAAIIVNPVNDAPLADDDPGYVVDEDGQLVVIAADGVLANDSDVDSDTLTASLVSSVSHGTLVLGANGSFTYMPEADFFGQDTFTYRANDGEDISNLATVTITVNSQPDAPVAVDDLVTMFEDTVVSSGGLLPELDLVEWSANGHFYALVREQVRWEDARDAAAAMNYRGAIGHLATISSLQEQTFLNQNVLNTITGEVFVGLTDEVAEGDFRWVTGEPFDFTYWRGGEPNNANNDDYVELQSSFGWRWNDESINKQNLGYIVEFEPPFADNLLLNDTDVDGDPLTVILDENNTVEHGVLDLNDDGTFTYTPEADFFGSDTFSYRASDGVLQSELATVTITVAPVNDAPTADDDGGYELDEDGELIVGADAGVLVGDIDSEGDPLTARLVEDASHGTLALAEDGSFTYTPDEDFFGEDSFTYVANDGESDSNVATVTIDVNAVQDAPVTVDDKYVADEDTAFPPPVEIPPGLTLVEWPENGNFYGIIEESKTWAQAKAAVEALEVSGNPGHLLTITSDAENDFVNAAVLSSTSARRIFIGLNDTETEGTFVWVTGEPVTFSNWNVGEPSNSGDEDVVELHWLGGAWRWNDVPSWFKNPAYVVEFESSPDPSVLDNDRDADGDPLIVTLVENVKHGALDLRPDGTFTYVPDPEFSGKDTFTYRASDGTLESELATVTITVEPVNDAPTADDDGGYELDEDGELIVDAAAGVLVGDTDAEDDPLTARLVDDVEHGTLALADEGSFSYTPNADFFGEDSFTYVANDGELDSQLATVTITVNPIDDPPLAVDDVYDVNEDVVLVAEGGLAVTTNDEEPDGDALAVTLIDDAMHGTLELAANGTFVYTPGQDFNGTDSFTYRVDDGTTTSNVATVTITVVPVNDPPLAEDDAFRVPTSGSLVVAAEAGLLANDSDVEGDPLTVILVEGPAHGTLLLSDDGSFEYTPEGTFNRFDSFTYRAGDGQDLSEIATVSLTLDAPLVEAGDHILRANTPGQTISILVSGEHDVSGLNLFVQIGDGGPELVEFGLPAGTRGPRITAISLKTGTIFASVGDPQIDEPGNLPQVINSTIALAGDPTTIEADGTLAILTIDTTGLFGGEWDLLLSGVLPGLVGGPFETDFAGEPAIIESGKLRIVPAEVVDRLVFYNDSVFDGRDAAAGEADDAAIAPDKTALLSGNKATFANYTSFAGGITGVMLDVARLLVPDGLTAGDFTFRNGRSNDPSAWQPTDAPASVTVRSGAGVNGSDRISLTWPAGTIEGTWLEVTLKSNANTGLRADDVFYFGSAVGESGNKPTDALVNATDVIAVRNNPRGPLDQADLENRLDFNRDALVNATDLVLARDHTTGLFSALPLITPVATGGAPSPGAAAAAAAAPQAAGAPAGEMPTIVVGEYTLAADTPNQQIEIFVSGGQSVAGVNLVAQVGDGGPELVDSGLPAGTDGPAISSVDLKTGTIFAALDDPQFDSASLPQVHFTSLGIASANTTVSADGLLVTLFIDTTGIFGGSFQLLLAGVLPQLTNGPFATDFAGIPIEITNGIIIVESSQPADLTGNGFVDFEDLTVLLAAWNQDVSAAEGNLVDADNTPVNFEDLTVLLAAWTGPGPAGAPVGRRLAAAQETSPNAGSGFESDVERETPRQAAAYFDRLVARRDHSHSALRRLQSAAVDRAMADDGLSDGLPRRENHFSRRSRRSGR